MRGVGKWEMLLLKRMMVRKRFIYELTFKPRPNKMIRAFCGVFQAAEQHV